LEEEEGSRSKEEAMVVNNKRVNRKGNGEWMGEVERE
jgi:hypothetical protein